MERAVSSRINIGVVDNDPTEVFMGDMAPIYTAFGEGRGQERTQKIPKESDGLGRSVS